MFVSLKILKLLKSNSQCDCIWRWAFGMWLGHEAEVPMNRISLYKGDHRYLPFPLLLCAAKSLQSCPTLSDPIDGSLPGSPIPGILQARTLEWGTISFSNAWKWKVKVKSLSRIRLLATPWIAAYQAPPYMGFSRQEYWSGVPLPSPSTMWGHSKKTTF